jgi:hypothetical protein
MKVKKNIKLPLTTVEKLNLRQHKVKIIDIANYTVDEVEVLLHTSPARAKEIFALAQFQTIPSIGIKFAEDLVFLGYYTIQDLENKDGALLTNDYEQKKGFWVDPCVEDQFRLVVNFAQTNDSTKNWWHFTQERKKYRSENGYPQNRPKKAWHETLTYQKTASL